MTENMNNYIGRVDAEWVDPAVKLPPEKWPVMCRSGTVRFFSACYIDGYWYDDHGLFCDPIAWLRVGGPSTAIPREKVQAAVDELSASISTCKCHCFDCENCNCDDGTRWDLAIMRKCTGITPSEVQ